MPATPEYIKSLVENPRESLAVEVKGWFDPDRSKGKAKILKACIAMRNRGVGGFLLVGFDNTTLAPITNGMPRDVRGKFHADEINQLVNRHASERFEVHVHFAERGGQEFPVLEVEGGAEIIVAARRRLADMDGSILVETNDVYVRSLSQNNTPSTGKPRAEDWRTILSPLFDNREADLGRFLRRHLDQRQLGTLAGAAVSAGETRGPSESQPHVKALTLLDDGYDRYQAQRMDRGVEKLPRHGSLEVAAVVEGNVPGGEPTRSFMNLIGAANPGYTGWPLWIDSRGFPKEEGEPGQNLDPTPRVVEEGWETFLYSYERDSWYNHLDFWRVEPDGRFYAYRAFEDDITEGKGYPETMTTLDLRLVVWRVAEAIAVPMAFARAMDLAPEETTLHYAFRWSGLRGRELSSWTEPAKHVTPGLICHEQVVRSPVIDIPLDTPISAIAPYVQAATSKLFASFGGFELDATVVEDLTKSALKL